MKLLVVIAFLAAAAAAEPLSPVLGAWYTEGVENGIAAQFIVKNNADGTFVKTIRDNTDCQTPKTWIETGHWHYTDAVYAELTESVDGTPVDTASPEFSDRFDATWPDAEHSIQTDRKTKIAWTLTRVPVNFILPMSSHCNV
jgi:hypothetical protein